MSKIEKRTIDNITWKAWNGVPISENNKLEWIKRGIQYLKNNPDQWWTGTSSGESYVKIIKGGCFGLADYYEVIEYHRKRTAYVDRDPDEKDVCRCEITTLSQKGCQCGGI